MRIVVSLTTLPGRYRKLARTLESIYNQTVPPDVIYLGVPKRAKRLNIDYGELPPNITNRCTIVPLDDDYGPICKIVGGLLSEHDHETIIITLDDDIVYPATIIEVLIKHATEYPDSAIGSTGLLLGHNIFGYSNVSSVSPTWNGITGFKVPPEGRAVDMLCGVSGVLYRRKFFPEDITPMLEYTYRDNDLFMNDDILLSVYIGSRGIEKRLFMDIPFFAPSKFFDPNIDIKDSSEISFSRVTFLQRFHRAVNTGRRLGLFTTPAPADMDDSFLIRMIFLVILVIILILFIWMIAAGIPFVG